MHQLQNREAHAAAALLKIGGVNLLLPQADIRALESAADVDVVAPALQSVGWVKYAQKKWPVYCLSEALALQLHVPPARRACAMMILGAGYIGILCDDMSVIKDYAAQQYALPDAMRLPATPVLQLLAYQQGIACTTNARLLTEYVEQLVLNA
jgi:hypothetical protein